MFPSPLGTTRVINWFAVGRGPSTNFVKLRGSTMFVATAQPGLIVTDAALKLHAFNTDAIQILSFPQSMQKIPDPHAWLSERVSRLFERRTSVSQLQSGQRTYLCKSFPVKLDGAGHKSDRPGLVLLLERKSISVLSIDRIAEHFALTDRECETVRLLFEGLSSKEIAARMKISHHTVNAFVRLVMVKMGVSSRSGIVGKIARTEI
jgi:DNA-binding CsgD family transcriptional regulator